MSYSDVPPYHPLSELFGDYDKLAHEILNPGESPEKQEKCRRYIHLVRKSLDRLLVAPCSQDAEKDIIDKMRESYLDYSEDSLITIADFVRFRLIEDNNITKLGPDPFETTASL